MQKELKVDMDWRPPEDWLTEWESCVRILLRRWDQKKPKFTYEMSKHGWHIRVKLDFEISDTYVLLFQFLLGDDRVRCKLNYGRWRAGIEDWNKLWKCKVGRDNKK